MSPQAFRQKIYQLFQKHARTFPWRKTQDPYKIMVSEFMLQQTQTSRVLPKYKSFLKRFPTVERLAKSSLHEVLKKWQGLGYNRRGKYLHESAKVIAKEHYSIIPNNKKLLLNLPGVGEYTASAILTFAYNRPEVFIETNIRSVFIHFFFSDREDVSDKEILQQVNDTLDRKNPCSWYYALMDVGVYIKARYINPNRKSKHYTKQSKFEGSNRQIRGKVLKLLVNGSLSYQKLAVIDKIRIKSILNQLQKEGIVSEEQGRYFIN